MKSLKSHRTSPFTWSALALASALLFGCGGADKSTDSESAGAASVTVSESAAGLSVKTTTGEGSRFNGSHVEAALYTFAAKINAGTDAGQALDGTLVLQSVAQDDGSTALTGKLIGGKLTATPSDAVIALQAEFATALEALKTACKTDVEALQATLKAALEAAATPDAGRRLNEAQRAAIKTFIEAVKTRSEQFKTDSTALVTSYQDKVVAAGGDASSITPWGSHGGKLHGRKTVYDVTGTQAADGSLTLKLTAGSTVLTGTGTLAADGSLAGTLAGPATDDTGTWQATALVKPTPTPPSPPASSASSTAN
jgi:hypothetical protein